jgi:hypothetical protein
MKGIGHLSGLAMLLSLLGCTETFEESYPDVQAVRADGAIDRGWVPDWIPEGARNIREIHKIDTSESILSFEISPDARWTLPSKCQPVAYPKITAPRLDRDWWPADSDLQHSFQLHRCPGEVDGLDVYVGTHGSGRRVVHWRSYAR